MKKIFNKISIFFKKSGIFSKIIVIFCILYCVRIVEWGIRYFEETQMEAPTLISAALALFGGELLLLCLKRVFTNNDRKNKKEKNENSSETEESIDNEPLG